MVVLAGAKLPSELCSSSKASDTASVQSIHLFTGFISCCPAPVLQGAPLTWQCPHIWWFPLMIPRYAARCGSSDSSRFSWSVECFVCFVFILILLNKTEMSNLNVTTGASSSFSLAEAKESDCLNHRINLIFMATRGRTCDLHGEERESFALCLRAIRKSRAETLQPKKDPFLHVRAAFVKFRPRFLWIRLLSCHCLWMIYRLTQHLKAVDRA